MKNEKQSVEESSRILISLAISIAITLLSVGGFIFLLSRSGCF